MGIIRIVNAQRVGGADIDAGQTALDALCAAQLHQALPRLDDLERAVAGDLALAAVDAVL